jgi:hypothetical protein
MPNIRDPELSIQVDRATRMATISVRCDLVFTDSEVDRMNLFGLSYALQCQVLNATVPHADAVLSFNPQLFPRFRDGANTYEHPVFETLAATADLVGHTALVAQLILSNEDRDTVDVKRTQTVGVGLAAS